MRRIVAVLLLAILVAAACGYPGTPSGTNAPNNPAPSAAPSGSGYGGGY